MRNFNALGVSLAATAALTIGGCSSPEQPPAGIAPTPATSAPAEPGAPEMPGCQTDPANGYQPGGPLPPDAMDVRYVDTVEPIDSNLLALQKEVGTKAVSVVMAETLCVSVDGQPTEVTMSVPPGTEDRQQAVIILTDSYKAGQAFKLVGKPELKDAHVSVTSYGVDYAPGSQQIVRGGAAISVVGQEIREDSVGALHNMATERCQALEMTAEPPLAGPADLDLYHAVKEAVCNTLGFAADRRFLGLAYEDYSREFAGQPISPEINNTGKKILYPLLSRQQFDTLISSR